LSAKDWKNRGEKVKSGKLPASCGGPSRAVPAREWKGDTLEWRSDDLRRTRRTKKSLHTLQRRDLGRATMGYWKTEGITSKAVSEHPNRVAGTVNLDGNSPHFLWKCLPTKLQTRQLGISYPSPADGPTHKSRQFGQKPAEFPGTLRRRTG